MPPKKRTGGGRSGAAKKQKASNGDAKPSQPHIAIDEGFTESDDVRVHIDDDETIWDASLNLSNVSGNNNKFYMLQLLVDDKNSTYYAHTRWGRVGESGQVKTMDFDNLDAAKEEFDSKFKSKTGLTWEKRTDEPKANKYTFVEKAYEDDEEEDEEDETEQNGDGAKGVESQLDMPTQRLMELIFNENHFNSVLEEIGYNAEKLPLGKLGKNTLKTGFEQLKELASLIKHPSLAQNNSLFATGYRRVDQQILLHHPHAFGRNRPPPVDNEEMLRKEVAMLDTLTDMEVANTIMRANDKAKDASSVNLLDSRFQELGLQELAALDHKSDEFKQLQSYLIDSSAAGHSLRYRLQDIFRIERPGEHDRFAKSVKTIKDSNRLLLWHGSRTTNFGGILSQGLRIAPPEAPVNGYAFGKGIYLADLSSKSANYCVASASGGVGLLLLVEAELSNPMYEIDSGDPNAGDLAKKHNCIATKGMGRTGYTKWKDAGVVNKALEGVKMPDGKPEDDTKSGGFLQYNEYISYNVEHLKLRYLFKVAM
ncbi:hypothetical protein PG991_014745 [Apiospora marii]|uniref:Poly [ADP-ribose] polymerase n=1 Tax=Apiospora marii TaxID=335849 RepID=A0ABR1R4F3_9PEZI